MEETEKTGSYMVPLTKKELEALNLLSDEQIQIIIGRSNGSRSWLEFDLELRPEFLKRTLGATDEQFNTLRKAYPYNEKGRVSMSLPLKRKEAEDLAGMYWRITSKKD